MIEQKKQWLLSITWDSIVNVNRSLCQAQKVEPLTNARTYASTQGQWEKSVQKSMNLVESLEVCRQAFEQSPFMFNNGNTFAAIARSLVEDSLRNAPAVEAQIVRSTISHFAAGTIDRKELAQVLGQLSPLLVQSPAPTAVPAPSPAPATARPATEVAPRLTEVRPLASS